MVGAAVNSKAVNTLRIMYPKTMNVICFSHALDLVEGTFQTPNLDKFMKYWFRIFHHTLYFQGKVTMARKNWTVLQVLQVGGVSGSVKNR